MQLFFYGRIAEAPPQLWAGDVQYGFNGKRWSSTERLMRAARKRLNQRNQCGPGKHLVHLIQKDLLAGFLGQRVKAECDFIHEHYLRLTSNKQLVGVQGVLAGFP